MLTAATQIVAPEGWIAHTDVPGAGVVLRPVRDIGRFRTNILVAVTQVAATVELAHVAELGHRHLGARHRDLELLDEREVAVEGGDAYARVVAFELGATAHCIAQVHAMALGSRDDTGERVLVEVIATCPLRELEHHRDSIASVLAAAFGAADEQPR